MSEARRSGKSRVGRAAYFAAGGRLLVQRHPVRPFCPADHHVTSSDAIQGQVCEALAVRVAELNLWRPGCGLHLPFLRLATVAGASRSRLALASFEALFRAAGGVIANPPLTDSAIYRDVERVVCKPIPDRIYQPPIAVQADGEVLGESCATIEMAGLDIFLLSRLRPKREWRRTINVGGDR